MRISKTTMAVYSTHGMRQYNATFNSLLNCIRSLVKFIFIMSNCDININCPANAGFASPSFFHFEFSEKNVDKSPAALSIVMELWKYYKSCTFIRVNKKKYIEPTNIRPNLELSLHLLCKYGHNGNVKSRFSQNEKRKNHYTNNKRRKEKMDPLHWWLFAWIHCFFVGVNKKKYGQMKGKPLPNDNNRNVKAVDISLFMLIMSTRYNFRLSIVRTNTHPSPLLFYGILFALISPENAH